MSLVLKLCFEMNDIILLYRKFREDDPRDGPSNWSQFNIFRYYRIMIMAKNTPFTLFLISLFPKISFHSFYSSELHPTLHLCNNSQDGSLFIQNALIFLFVSSFSVSFHKIVSASSGFYCKGVWSLIWIPETFGTHHRENWRFLFSLTNQKIHRTHVCKILANYNGYF